ncbi:MAG: PilN domain-containing protein [Patescibacteria group bacterium]
MIQLNLLPDVKLEFIKAQRAQRLAFSIAFLAGGVSIALLVVLLSLTGLQNKHLNDLSKDIASSTAKLQKQPQIGKILTVQNQLESLTGLHDQKPAAPKVLEYINQVTPAQVDITSLTVDFTEQTATITGTADALSSVNKYVDTLKFTTYTTQDDNTAKPAFSNVVLSSFGLGDSSGGKANPHPANYTITLSYDPAIFDNTQRVTLSVPNLISTRSESQPADLFKANTTTKAKTTGN